MTSGEIIENQAIEADSRGEGMPPLLWGSLLSLLTFAFLALMLLL